MDYIEIRNKLTPYLEIQSKEVFEQLKTKN